MSTRNPSRAVCAILAALAAGCTARGGDEGKPDEAQPVVGAETAVAKAGPFTEAVSALGTVAPRAGHVAALSAPAPTRVAGVNVSAGQHVKAGDTLVVLEQTAFEAAARSAEAAVRTAQSARDRAQHLVDQGISARSTLEQADADLARARADNVAAQRTLELSVLRAPFDGVVTRLATSLGASVDASAPLVELADPTALDVLLDLSSADAARAHLGDRVALRAGEGSGGETLATGEIADIAGVVDSASRTVTVRVRVIESRRDLRIGETVWGDIGVAVHPHAVTIPIEALVPEGDGFKVFVVDANSVAHERDVTVGGRTEAAAEIVKGLAAGERVVTYGAFGVDDSAKIVPAKPGAVPAKPGAAGAAPAKKDSEQP